jgi:hypothetical protein
MRGFMRQLRLFWRSVFDVRPGEGWRALFLHEFARVCHSLGDILTDEA